MGLMLLVTCLCVACTTEPQTTLPTQLTEIKTYSLDTLDDIPNPSENLSTDQVILIEGKGSLKINADKPFTVTLFETGDIDIDDAKIIYQAKLKSEKFKGKAYLEMWAYFDNKGRFFSRDITTPIADTVDWTTEETPFYLKKGENPDNIELNLVIEGEGTIWVDDVKLLKEDL